MQDSASYPGPHDSQRHLPSPGIYCPSTSNHHHSACPSFDQSSLSCKQCSAICHDDVLEDRVDVLDTNGTSVVSIHARPLMATFTPFDDSIRPAVVQRTTSTASITTFGLMDQELEGEDFMINAYRIRTLKASPPSSRQPSQNQQEHCSRETTGIMASMTTAAATAPAVNSNSLTTAFSSPVGPLGTVSSSDSALTRRQNGYVDVVDTFDRDHLPYIGYYTSSYEADHYEALYAINYGEQDNSNTDDGGTHEQELLISRVLNPDEGARRQSRQEVNSLSGVEQHQRDYFSQPSTNPHGMSRVLPNSTPLPTYQSQTNDTIAHQIRRVHASHIMDLHRQWEQQRERLLQEIIPPEQQQQQSNHAPNPYPGSVPMSRHPPPPLLPPHIQRRFQDIPPILQSSPHGLSSSSGETIHPTESVASPHRTSFQSSVYRLAHDEARASGAASLTDVTLPSLPLPSTAIPPRSPPSTENVDLQNQVCPRALSTGSNTLYTNYEGGTLQPGEQWRRGDREMIGR